jgi:hypothetical protein
MRKKIITKLACEYLLVDEMDLDLDLDEDDNIGVFTLSPELELFLPPLFIFLVLDIYII